MDEDLDNIAKTIKESLRFTFSKILKRKLNIGIVCHPFMGGSGIFATSIAMELAKRGHNIHLIVYKRPFKINKKLIKVHLIPVKSQAVFEYFPITLTTASKISEVIKKHNLDLINVHYALPYSVSSYLAKQIVLTENIKIPVITSLHGTDIHTIGRKKDFKPIIRFTLSQSDGITAVSKFLAEQSRELDIESEIKVIYNYVDSKRFKREKSKELTELKREFTTSNEKIIFHASNFRKIKRIEDIIMAFNRINRKVKSKLILAGTGPERAKIKELVEKLKLKKRVFFLGQVKKIEKYYAISDLFMLVSEKEGCPLSILEAMASEVPVVATNVGGIPEILINGKTGYLVEKGDITDMARKAVRILTDKRKRKQMGEAGRQEVLEKYNVDKVVTQYEDYFRRILLKF